MDSIKVLEEITFPVEGATSRGVHFIWRVSIFGGGGEATSAGGGGVFLGIGEF